MPLQILSKKQYFFLDFLEKIRRYGIFLKNIFPVGLPVSFYGNAIDTFSVDITRRFRVFAHLTPNRYTQKRAQK